LILDEADRLLDLDFGPVIDRILKAIPRERKTYLFSATMTTKVAKLQRASLSNPIRLEVNNKSAFFFCIVCPTQLNAHFQTLHRHNVTPVLLIHPACTERCTSRSPSKFHVAEFDDSVYENGPRCTKACDHSPKPVIPGSSASWSDEPKWSTWGTGKIQGGREKHSCGN